MEVGVVHWKKFDKPTDQKQGYNAGVPTCATYNISFVNSNPFFGLALFPKFHYFIHEMYVVLVWIPVDKGILRDQYYQ